MSIQEQSRNIELPPKPYPKETGEERQMTFGLTDQLVSLEREEWLAYSAGDYSEAARLSSLKASYTAMRQAQELRALSETGQAKLHPTPFPFPTGPSPKVPNAKTFSHGIEGYLIHGCECWRCSRSKRGCDSIRALGVKNA